ncbi:hypothetical protein ERJ75_000667500 [Trypanosoma vivax]|nr:hypothetical protein ERJ75_000667500 [Trypanosoma vivax]
MVRMAAMKVASGTDSSKRETEREEGSQWMEAIDSAAVAGSGTRAMGGQPNRCWRGEERIKASNGNRTESERKRLMGFKTGVGREERRTSRGLVRRGRGGCTKSRRGESFALTAGRPFNAWDSERRNPRRRKQRRDKAERDACGLEK